MAFWFYAPVGRSRAHEVGAHVAVRPIKTAYREVLMTTSELTAGQEPAPDSSRTADSPLVARLREEHMRTRNLLRRAREIIRLGGPEDVIVRVARAMETYLVYWNPLHELDEEQSVAPALYAYAHDEATRELIDHMTRDHQRLDNLRDGAASVWRGVANDPSTFERVRNDMRHDTREITRILARHIAWEERNIFPRVRILLPRALQEQILSVMKARRASMPPL